MAFPTVAHRTVNIDGVNICYRGAGLKGAPAALLLHGFPTSSHMFRNLIPALADEFHLVAPHYPGFGNSSAPPRATRTTPRSPGSSRSRRATSRRAEGASSARPHR